MNQLNTLVDTISNELNQLKADLVKFNAGNAAAGTRVRKYALNIQKLTKDVRNQVSALKK